jgi:hypothetical protein
MSGFLAVRLPLTQNHGFQILTLLHLRLDLPNNWREILVVLAHC